MLFKKLTISLVICLLSIMCITQIYGLDVMIGGESIGIVLNYDAICITGFYDIEVNQQIIDPSRYFKINDLIIEVENQKVTSIEEKVNKYQFKWISIKKGMNLVRVSMLKIVQKELVQLLTIEWIQMNLQV